MGCKSNDWCLYKERKGHRRHTEGHVKMEAEIGGMQPQAKDAKYCQSHQKLEEARKDSSLEPFRGSMALLTPGFWTSSLQDC